MIFRIILIAIIYGIGFYFLFKDDEDDEEWTDDDYEDFLATIN